MDLICELPFQSQEFFLFVHAQGQRQRQRQRWGNKRTSERVGVAGVVVIVGVIVVSD